MTPPEIQFVLAIELDFRHSVCCDITSYFSLSLCRSAAGVLVSDPQSRDIKIDSYTLSFHGRLLFENASVSFNYPQRYALLGENGSGKSTLLQSLAGRDIAIPEHIDIYMVRGEAPPSDQGPVEFIVAAAKEKVERLEKRVEELSGSTDEADTAEIERLLEEIEDMDPNTFEAKAGSILHGLGFSQQMMARPTKDMSGGWRMRVALARALFIKPHLLLLGTLNSNKNSLMFTSYLARVDEPTNHLDLAAVVWLEAYLSTYNHILVITSHSADFLDSVCTNTIDLTPKKKVRGILFTSNVVPTLLRSAGLLRW
jgi:ATP-binding cassette, subfamily F, member 2